MAFVAAPRHVSLALIATLNLQPVVNTFHYKLAAAATATDLFNICTVCLTWIAGEHANLSAQYQVIKAYARALDSLTAPTMEVNPSSAIVGTDVTELMPNNASFAVTRFTGLAGRANRGRVYWPGITDGMRGSANTVTTGYAASFVTALALHQNDQGIGTAAAQEVILHRSLGTSDAVVGYRYADLNIDSQRRRLPGHNIHH